MVSQGLLKHIEPKREYTNLMFWRLSCALFPEKVHFQHTAKFITQLINEKANYTLQVCGSTFMPL